MRRIIYVVVLAVCLAGCTVDQQFVQSVDSAWDVIGPRYVDYVQADATLDDQSKETRIRTAELLTRLIEEAKR